MKTSDLLTQLGWPAKYTDQQGSLVWQKSSSSAGGNLPPTASLTVNDKTIKATVLNLVPSSTVTRHLHAEWDISGAVPVLKKCLSLGKDLFATYPTRLVEDRAVQDFCSSVALLNTFPLTTLTVPRVNSHLPDLSGSA